MFLNEQIKLVQVNRLDEMVLKSCFAAPANVLLHAKTCERDSEDRTLGLHPFYQINAAAIGQGKIADEHVKFLFGA